MSFQAYLDTIKAKTGKETGRVPPPGEPATGRLEAARTWTAMVTHRVRVSDPAEVDDELRGWLRQACDAAAGRPA